MKEQPTDSSIDFINKKIDVTFTNEVNQKEENYILLDEENETLLIKGDFTNNNYQPRIQELFQNESNDQYYINKKKLKEKYLNNCFELDKNDKDIVINNHDKNEMEELYKETALKHPRKLINGEIKKYSFCSWTGFFTCQKCEKLEINEFFPLGFGISSYFKTLKFFIVFLLIISCVNFVAINHYLKYKSTINDSSFFFKTTLGNTKITTYNAVYYHFDRSNYPKLALNCQENKIIGKFIYGLKLNDAKENLENQTEINFTKYDDRMDNEYLEYFNKKILNCNFIKECNLDIDKEVYDFYDLLESFTSKDIYLYYECIDKSLLPENAEKNSLKSITGITTIFTIVILIFMYYFYRYATDIDNKNYHKDKIIINNYTLALRGLKRNTKYFYQELNDLVSHLNNIISTELKSNNVSFEQDLSYFRNNDFGNYYEFLRNRNMYIFDISISTVNQQKMAIIDKIKSLKDEISDLKEGNDTIGKKVVNKIYNAVTSVTSLYTQIKNKNKEDDDEDTKPEEALVDTTNENITDENQKKIDKNKEKIKKQIKKVSKNQFGGLHMESNKKTYVDIYITFRNPLISNFIYECYQKTFLERVLLFLCCRIKTIKTYYYKRQWLNFYISNNAPTNIIWENSYISTKKKICRRVFTFIIAFFIIIIASLIFYYLYGKENSADDKIDSYIITGIIQVISIISSTILKKLTQCEKNSTLSKQMSSDIEKYFFLNFAVSTISVNIKSFFTYNSFDSTYPVVMSSILQSMLLSIVTAHLSTLGKYFFNLLKRYLDSDFTHGKKTKLKKKMEYKELYIGPDFPISERLSSFFVDFGLCLLYGSSCPLIYLFFTLCLITTFIVDKILVIHYYKKPPYYDNYFTLLTRKILFLAIIVHIYGTVYYISNPYLFNLYQNDSIDFGYKGIDYYLFLNPFTIFNRLYCFFTNNSINIYNLNNLDIPYFVLFLLLFLPLIMKKMCDRKKKVKKETLHNAPNIDIGMVYSLDELNKYYEVKKLELFKFLLNFDKKDSKEFKKYTKLADHYKNVLDYIKQNINFKNSMNYKKNENINNGQNNIINQNIMNTNPDANTLIVRENGEKNSDRFLIGDASYNLAFIPNYEMFEYFDLLYLV